MLPLYRAPDIVIQVKGKEYLVPKALLCRFSRYIATGFGQQTEPLEAENSEPPKVEKPDSSKGGMFKFFKGEKHRSSKEVNHESPKEQKSEKESREYSSPLVDGPPPYYSTTEPVVLNSLTTWGFETVLQWLYTGCFTIHGGSRRWISSLIEVARCSDLLQIAELDALIIEKAKPLFSGSMASPAPLVGQHIYEAARLPKRHAMRCLIANSLVSNIIRDTPFALSKEIRETPEFEEEFLEQLKATLATASCKSEPGNSYAYKNNIVDPISGYRICFNPLEMLQDPEKGYFVGYARHQMSK